MFCFQRPEKSGCTWPDTHTAQTTPANASTTRFMVAPLIAEPNADLEAPGVRPVRKPAVRAWHSKVRRGNEDDRRCRRGRRRCRCRSRVRGVVVLRPDVGVEDVEPFDEGFDHQAIGRAEVSREA